MKGKNCPGEGHAPHPVHKWCEVCTAVVETDAKGLAKRHRRGKSVWDTTGSRGIGRKNK